VAAVAGAICYLSVGTAPPEDPVVPGIASLLDLALDKWRHFVAYAGLGGSLAYATADWDWSDRRLAAVVLAVTVCYGFGIETVQALLPHRYFGWDDVVANVLGALLVLPWFALRPYVDPVRIRAAILRR
jgi:VanZ family protein